jgi:hypothetical protein
MRHDSGETQNNHSDTYDWDTSHQKLPGWSAMAAPQAKVPHALDEHEIDQPECGRDIVRKGPRLYQPTEAKDKAGGERETHATITNDPRKRN